MSLETDEVNAIIRVVEEWEFRKDKPPFSYEQLITMAIAVRGRPLAEYQILTWIAINFKYYSDAFFSFHDEAQEDAEHPEWNEGFPGYETQRPLLTSALPIIPGGEDRWCRPLYGISASGARIILRDVLPSRNQGIFPFLRLEPEVRAMIYDMVLGFPKSGLVFHGRRWDLQRHDLALPETCKLRAVSKDFEEQLSLDYNICEDEETWQLPPLKEILALLLVNKQLHHEAVPVFYRLNTFIIHDFYELNHSDFYKLLAPSRQQYLRHIAFVYESYSDSKAEHFEWLLELEELRKITLSMNDREWEYPSEYSPKEGWIYRPGNPSKIAGLQVLLRLNRGVQVNIVGNCTKIIKYWKSELSKRTPESQ